MISIKGAGITQVDDVVIPNVNVGIDKDQKHEPQDRDGGQKRKTIYSVSVKVSKSCTGVTLEFLPYSKGGGQETSVKLY